MGAGDLISSLHSEYSCLLGHLLSHDYSFGDVESDAHYAGDSKLHASLHTCPLLVPSLTGPRGGCVILANRRAVNNTIQTQWSSGILIDSLEGASEMRAIAG